MIYATYRKKVNISAHHYKDYRLPRPDRIPEMLRYSFDKIQQIESIVRIAHGRPTADATDEYKYLPQDLLKRSGNQSIKVQPYHWFSLL